MLEETVNEYLTDMKDRTSERLEEAAPSHDSGSALQGDYVVASRKLAAATLKYHTIGELEPIGVSIDTTQKCNLRCDHCYQYNDEDVPFERNKEPEPMSGDDWIDRIEEVQEEYPFITHATWVGGEPLMRWELVKEGAQKFETNYVVTNGTMPIPDEDEYKANIDFEVSFDGPRSLHNDLRGNSPGHDVFQQALDNAAETTSDVFAHGVVTAETVDEIDTIVDDAYRSDALAGIRFSFYVADRRDSDDPLRMSDEDRDLAVSQLQDLRQEYDEFLAMSKKAIEYLGSDHQEEVFEEGCMLRAREDSPGANLPLDIEGEEKGMCIFDAEGTQPDCGGCGCTVGGMTYLGMEEGRFPNMHVDYSGDLELSGNGVERVVADAIYHGVRPAVRATDSLLENSPKWLVSEDAREKFWQKQIDMWNPEI